MRVLLENTTFPLHKVIRNAGIIRGRVLYEEIRYLEAAQLMLTQPKKREKGEEGL